MLGISVPAPDETALPKGYLHLYNRLIPLLRTQSDALDAYLEMVACNATIVGTRTQAHCYFVALGACRLTVYILREVG